MMGALGGPGFEEYGGVTLKDFVGTLKRKSWSGFSNLSQLQDLLNPHQLPFTAFTSLWNPTKSPCNPKRDP